MTRTPRRLAFLALLCLFGGGVGGCARVKPWQREIHGKRVMNADADPAERKLDGHVHEYREGSVGGTGVGGGGCGCN